MTTLSAPSLQPLINLPSSSSSPNSHSHLSFINSTITPTRRRRISIVRSSSSQVSASSSIDTPVVLGCGGINVDFLATLDAFPQPDDKVRCSDFQVQGGGNAGNSLTCAARLGLNPRIISKVADDAQGKSVIEELEADGVDTSFLVVSQGGNSPFTYVIVDKQTKTRTCIHTPGYPPLVPDDLSRTSLLSALDRARLVYFDGRLHETALVVAKGASEKKIPILVDAERKREGLDDLLSMADYVVCSAKFPQEWTGAPSIPSALVSMALKLPNIKFVVVTLGEDGCIMLERSTSGGSDLVEEMDVDSSLELLKQSSDVNSVVPTCISSKSVSRLKAKEIGAVNGWLRVGTAEKIPEAELIDTTGAGDAFIGAVLYAICANMPPEKMLPFAASVAAACCRALGARSGLPKHTNPRLSSFLKETMYING